MLATGDAAAPAAADPRSDDSSLPLKLAQRSDRGSDGVAKFPSSSCNWQLSDPPCASRSGSALEQVDLVFHLASSANADCSVTLRRGHMSLMALERWKIPAGFRAHIVAAEEKVSQNLLQFLRCMEKRLADTLREVAIDVSKNMAIQAVECIRVSEQKAAYWFRELNHTKEQALDMLMRLKQATDVQISEAKAQILFERARAHEAEAKLCAAQQHIKKLKVELKHTEWLLEETQKVSLPSSDQGLPLGVIERSESEQAAVRTSSVEGERLTLHTQSTPAESALPLSSPLAAACNTFATRSPDDHGQRGHAYEERHEDLHQRLAAQGAAGAIGTQQLEKNTVENRRILPRVPIRDSRSADFNNRRELSPASRGSRKEEAFSDKGNRELIWSKDSTHCSKQGEASLTSCDDLRHAQLQSADPEVRFMNVLDEERSCLSAERTHGNSGSSVAELTVVEEYQSDLNHDGRKIPETSTLSNKLTSIGRECALKATRSFGCYVVDGVEVAKRIEEISSSSTATGNASKLEDTGTFRGLNKPSLRIAKELLVPDSVTTATTAQSLAVANSTSLELASPTQDLCLEQSPIAMSDLSDGLYKVLGEDDSMPDLESGSPGIQPPRKKRRQAAHPLKDKKVAGAKRSKGAEEAMDRRPSVGSGACDDLNRGDRQVMLVARQLVKLAGSRR